MSAILEVEEPEAIILIASTGYTVKHDDVVIGERPTLLEALALKRVHDDPMTDPSACARCDHLWRQRTCDKHGAVMVVDAGSSRGFAGGTIYYETLSCGCCDVDESDDERAAR